MNTEAIQIHTQTPLEKERETKKINDPELLTALRFWAFRCPKCRKICLKMADIRTDVSDRHGYFSNRQCFNCNTMLDYDRDIIGDSHALDSDYEVLWAVDGKTSKGRKRVTPYLLTKCVYCGHDHYFAIRDNRLNFNECVCQTGTTAEIAEAHKPMPVATPPAVEGEAVEEEEEEEIKFTRKNDMVLKCHICGQECAGGSGLRIHQRLAHDYPPAELPTATNKETEKLCNKCGKYKPKDEFSKDASRTDGLAWVCKECDTKRRRELYQARKGNPPAPTAKAADNINTKTKYCPNCQTLKPLDEFHKSAKGADGHQSWCKKCKNNFYKPEAKPTPPEVKLDVERMFAEIKSGQTPTKPHEPIASKADGHEEITVNVPLTMLTALKLYCFEREKTKSQVAVDALAKLLTAEGYQ
jgi:hypothetical protein